MTWSSPCRPRTKASFYDRFDHAVLPTAPLDVLLARVSTRNDQPHGTTPEDRAAISEYVRNGLEPLLRRGATRGT